MPVNQPSVNSGKKLRMSKGSGRDKRTLVWVLVVGLLLLIIVSMLMWRGCERRRLQAIDSSEKKDVILPVRVLSTSARDIPRFIEHSVAGSYY